MSSAWEREWSRKSNRPTYKDRHARNSSWPGELISITGRIHLRRLAFSPSVFPCSRAADHTFSSKWISAAKCPTTLDPGAFFFVYEVKLPTTRLVARIDGSPSWPTFRVAPEPEIPGRTRLN